MSRGLSPLQLCILKILNEKPWVIADHVYERYWGLAFNREKRTEPVPLAIRVTVSRSLANLARRGLIERTPGRAYRLTPRAKRP